jgi:hypothetical protein
MVRAIPSTSAACPAAPQDSAADTAHGVAPVTGTTRSPEQPGEEGIAARGGRGAGLRLKYYIGYFRPAGPESAWTLPGFRRCPPGRFLKAARHLSSCQYARFADTARERLRQFTS